VQIAAVMQQNNVMLQNCANTIAVYEIPETIVAINRICIHSISYALVLHTMQVNRITQYGTYIPTLWAVKRLFFCRQHCAKRKAPVFKLLRGRFWGFSPIRGDTLHRLGWKLAWRRGTRRSPSSKPNFTPSVQR